MYILTLRVNDELCYCQIALFLFIYKHSVRKLFTLTIYSKS